MVLILTPLIRVKSDTIINQLNPKSYKRADKIKAYRKAQAMIVFIAIVKILAVLNFCDAMTMKQIRSTGKMMRKTCQPKNNVADEKIDPMIKGVFIEEREVMCYVACIMKMANAIKNGKLNYEAAMKQADLLLPDEIKEPAKEAITACKKVADSYKDVCESSFFVTKCIYNHNPSIFYFP